MSWKEVLKARRRCSWCGNPKGWNGKDCLTCNRGDFEESEEELVETNTELSEEERRKLQ
jgi:hypothetical protein